MWGRVARRLRRPLLVLAAGCAGPLTQRSSESHVVYRSEEAPAPDSVAIVCALDPQAAYQVEYGKLLCEFAARSLAEARPGVRVVPYPQVLSLLNEKGLARAYADLLRRYLATGILEREPMRRLGEALGVRWFLQPRLVTFLQTQTSRFSFFGLRIAVTRETQVKVSLELWEAESGALRWVGEAEVILASETLRSRAVPFEEAARRAVAQALRQLP